MKRKRRHSIKRKFKTKPSKSLTLGWQENQVSTDHLEESIIKLDKNNKFQKKRINNIGETSC